MNRTQLEHIIRASQISADNEIVVIGSQSIHALDMTLPKVAYLSQEANGRSHIAGGESNHTAGRFANALNERIEPVDARSGNFCYLEYPALRLHGRTELSLLFRLHSL